MPFYGNKRSPCYVFSRRPRKSARKYGEWRLMFLNRSDDDARSSAPRFLLGGGCAALLVLSFAGASLALTRSGADGWKPGFNELRLNHVPQPALTPGGLA